MWHFSFNYEEMYTKSMGLPLWISIFEPWNLQKYKGIVSKTKNDKSSPKICVFSTLILLIMREMGEKIELKMNWSKNQTKMLKICHKIFNFCQKILSFEIINVNFMPRNRNFQFQKKFEIFEKNRFFRFFDFSIFIFCCISFRKWYKRYFDLPQWGQNRRF